MKFSEAWLREWVNPAVDHAQLLEQLTMAGLEVKAVTPVAPKLNGVLVARVEQVAPHPAKGLSVCQVNDGRGSRQIVCGAPNLRPGLVSALAKVGAVLPGGVGVEQADIRGVASAGMLCSAAELGLGERSDGVLNLGEGCELGADLVDALTLDDQSIEVDLTPNRGDCLSLRGLAREVGVLNELPVRHQPTPPVAAQTDDSLAVRLDAAEGCPRYVGRVIRGLNANAETPLWMQERLRRSGLRRIGPIVDVTNYVMLELGQPMHAFDLGALVGSIKVRWANAGEALKLLDGRELQLDPSVLVIADEAGAVAIAGGMGGERSGVRPDTGDVFLESAYFDPLTVARTVRRFGLHTDASHRYERGVDFDLPALAMERATALLTSIAGGSPGPTLASEDATRLPQRNPVSLRQSRLQELAGLNFDARQVDALLARLDFRLLDRSATDAAGALWTIVPPPHRFDIEIEADLVEEVCRIQGYPNIPSILPAAPLAPRPVALERNGERRLQAQMAAGGFQEVITYSFVDPMRQELLDPGAQCLALANPMSSEQSVMRTNLLPGLTEALRFNQSRQRRRAQLFELGLCFKPGDALRQVLTLGGLMWGERGLEFWDEKPAHMDFFDLKGAVERLLEWALGDADVATFQATEDPALHPGQQAAIIVDGGKVGRLGRLHPEIERQLQLGDGVYVFEVSGEAVLARPLRKFAEIPKTPSARRDLAVVVEEAVSAQQVRDTLAKALGSALRELRLFDVYRSKDIDLHKKSMAIGLTFQSFSSTLTETEISRHLNKAMAALQAELGARLR